MGKPNLRLFLQFLLTLIKYFFLKARQIGRLVYFYKRWTVRGLLWRRGLLFRPAVHVGVAALALVAIAGGAVFGPLPSLANQAQIASPEVVAPPTVVQTDIPQDRPRAESITHTVLGGETLSSIGTQYGVSVETIKWANNLTSDQVSPGQGLKILPVTGVEYKVVAGDTLNGIAGKFSASAQAIVDFPFNDIGFDEVSGNFSVRVGQTVIIPDGQVPAPPKAKARPASNFAQVPVRSAAGGWVWPVGGRITQYFSWYHSGIDIAGPVGTPIVAARAGVVTRAQVSYIWGGINVAIDHGGGLATTYNHLSRFIVRAGQHVAQGQILGYRGSTGRSTGPHLHFEVLVNGHFVNPLAYLR